MILTYLVVSDHEGQDFSSVAARYHHGLLASLQGQLLTDFDQSWINLSTPRQGYLSVNAFFPRPMRCCLLDHGVT